MFWSRGSSRQRKAVLSALSAVGETGMTLLALCLAVNIPEGRLHAILEGLIRSGQVRRRGTASSAIPGTRTALYHLAAARHSAAVTMARRAWARSQPATLSAAPRADGRRGRSTWSLSSGQVGAVASTVVVPPAAVGPAAIQTGGIQRV